MRISGSNVIPKERDIAGSDVLQVVRRGRLFQGLIFVIASKIDCEHAITKEEGELFCASIGAIFIPMSAKTGEGGGKENLMNMTHQTLLRRTQHEKGSTEQLLCLRNSWKTTIGVSGTK